MDYYSTADMQARLGAEQYLRLLDRDADGTADSAVLTQIRTYSQGIVDTMLRDSHGTPFTTTIDDFIRDITLDLAISRAATSFPGASTQGSPYLALYTDAISRLKMLAANNRSRIGTSPPEPFGSLSTTTPSDDELPVFGAIANGTSISGF